MDHPTCAPVSSGYCCCIYEYKERMPICASPLRANLITSHGSQHSAPPKLVAIIYPNVVRNNREQRVLHDLRRLCRTYNTTLLGQQHSVLLPYLVSDRAYCCTQAVYGRAQSRLVLRNSYHTTACTRTAAPSYQLYVCALVQNGKIYPTEATPPPCPPRTPLASSLRA